ncbi:MAG: alpha/beta fold hydrolase [Rhizobiaceae bacterium]
MMLRALAIMLLAFNLAACGSKPTTLGAIALADQRVASAEQVFVATTRKPLDDKTRLFGGDRSDSLHFADITVSVPRERATGSITPPAEKPDLSRSFAVTSAALTDDEAVFASRLRGALAGRPAGKRSIFVFIHGYNVGFAGGLFSTAQLHHDYKMPGVAVHYSWPSAEKTALYLYDRDSAEFARDGLAKTLKIAAAANPDSIIVLGHSMGTLVTMEAMRTLAMTGQSGTVSKINALVLAAPDIDIDVFRSQLSALTVRPKTMVVLVSEEDKALKLSGKVRGDHARVGSGANKQELVDQGLIVLDIAALRNKDDRLAHSTYANSEQLIALVNSGLNLAALEKAQSGQGGLIGDSLGLAGDLLSSIVYLPAKIVGAR